MDERSEPATSSPSPADPAGPPSAGPPSPPGAPYPGAPYPGAPYPGAPYPGTPYAPYPPPYPYPPPANGPHAYPNAPYPNAPYPNAPYPNAPYPNAPYPNMPYAAAQGYGYPPAVPRGVGLPRLVAVEAVPGSDSYGVAIVGVAPITSGPAWASLIAGVASILVSLVVFCFGGVGASGGWGPIVAGAFAVLAALVGIAALVLGRVGYRQIRRAAVWGATKGRGLAVSGMICGTLGLLLTAVGLATAFAVAAVPAG